MFAKLEAINARMADLLVPFRSRYLYHPAMEGSASIKKVLPAFVPELRYDDLAIGDGDTASRQYLKCLKNRVTENEKQTIYADLKRYCAMDTWAEVRLTENTSVPTFTVTQAVDMTDLLGVRARLKATGSKISVTDFVHVAVVQALGEFPMINASTDGNAYAFSDRRTVGTS